MSLYQLNVTLHVLAALFWLGGMFFLAVVGAPVIRKVDPPPLRQRLFREIGRQFRLVGWTAIVVLLVTGTLNLHFRGVLRWDVLSDPGFWGSPFGRALLWKLVLVGVMLVLQGVHDFVHGPRASEVEPRSDEAHRLRRQAAWMARLNAVLGIVLVWVAVRLARGG